MGIYQDMNSSDIPGVRKDVAGNIIILDSLWGKSAKRWMREFGVC